MTIKVDNPYVLKPAHVQVDQWTGTAAAEEDITTASDRLHDVINLDRARFSILSIELQGGTIKGGKSNVIVYALDRDEHGLHDASHEEVMAFVQERGSVPVIQFAVNGVRAEQLTQRVFKRYQVRLSSRNWHDVPLRVERRGDLRLDNQQE